MKLKSFFDRVFANGVSGYRLRTANTTGEQSLDAYTTIRQFASWSAKQEIAIIVYDGSGKAIGSAKIHNNNDGTMTVTLSKDANVTLSSTSDTSGVAGDGKGKSSGDSSEVKNEGKSDSTADKVKTADVATLPLYGGLGGVMSLLLAALGIWKKRRG